MKSGYQITQKIKCPSLRSISRTASEMLKALRTLTLPAKEKNFMWKAIQNLLPTPVNIWHKKIIPDPICQVCKRYVESTSHALLTCKVVKKT